MLTVEVSVGDGRVTVDIPSRAWTRSWRDTISVRDGKEITDVGGAGADAAARPKKESGTIVTGPALAAESFDPILASAMVRYFVFQSAHDAGVDMRASLLGVRLRLRHPAWQAIPIDDRRQFLEVSRWPRVEVNGIVAVRRQPDIPILGWLIGGREIDPGLA
jgi:hypothetical protein